MDGDVSLTLGGEFRGSLLQLPPRAFSLKEMPVQSIYGKFVHSGILLAVVISCYF